MAFSGSASWAMLKGIVISIPVLVLSASVTASFLFFLLSSLSSCSCPRHSDTPVSRTSSTGVGVPESFHDTIPLSTKKEDVEWVINQIHANGLHMHDNVLLKGINPQKRAQQLEDLRQ
ncbi:PREDICTED: uncharacterized protein LOC109340417 [Lupinus angustifolius]|uniref:uncharacterized protein LOC109340417 n=1 Tax=Lupinus angustifolius TaxID=3871 RepID=UPI00092EEEBE|nr:PREDICTED: uncharacterized protein LOC109340417 [Lupinus angustifolius]